MITINGKILIFSDIHFGLNSNSEIKLKIAAMAMKEIISYVKSNDIKTCLFLGDWFHQRASLDVNTINTAYKCISVLAKYAKIYMIIGNHDAYLKNSIDINSVNIFQDIPNVIRINDITILSINNKKAICVPWLGDVSSYQKDTYDYMFGHFDISSKYLIKSYIEEHSSTDINLTTQANELIKTSTKTNDLVGDFVEITKKAGLIFAGHIHTRKEFISKERKFIFVGSPYQQNLGEKDCICGFYILNEDSTYKFNQINSTPHHVELYMSKLINNIDKFDFSSLTGNIVHKIYDIEVDAVIDSKISQHIHDATPFEELLPDYNVKISDSDVNENVNESIELLKKSKLDYISKYIDNIDQAILDKQNLNKTTLFKTLEKYYNALI